MAPLRLFRALQKENEENEEAACRDVCSASSPRVLKTPAFLTQRNFAVCFVLSVRTRTTRLKFNALQSASSNVLCELLLMIGDRFVLL
jgi:hypothetical protein